MIKTSYSGLFLRRGFRSPGSALGRTKRKEERGGFTVGYRADGVFASFSVAFRVSAIAALTVFLALSADAQNITTVAGGGPNGLAATSSSIGNPGSVVQDAAGNTYIADTFSSRILKVTAATGVLTVVAGNGVNSASGDNGPATAASLSVPQGVALDSNGNIYIADTGN